MSKDMSAPNWSRTLRRLRRLAEELRRHDFQVIEPPDVELPPSKRYAQSGPPAGVAVVVGESGPVLLTRPGQTIVRKL